MDSTDSSPRKGAKIPNGNKSLPTFTMAVCALITIYTFIRISAVEPAPVKSVVLRQSLPQDSTAEELQRANNHSASFLSNTSHAPSTPSDHGPAQIALHHNANTQPHSTDAAQIAPSSPPNSPTIAAAVVPFTSTIPFFDVSEHPTAAEIADNEALVFAIRRDFNETFARAIEVSPKRAAESGQQSYRRRELAAALLPLRRIPQKGGIMNGGIGGDISAKPSSASSALLFHQWDSYSRHSLVSSSVAPSASTSAFLSQGGYEALVAAMMRCHKKGYKGGVNYYYKVGESGASAALFSVTANGGEAKEVAAVLDAYCVPLPRDLTDPTKVSYESPPDPTLVLTMARMDDAGAAEPAATTAGGVSGRETTSIALRNKPSSFSQWLYEDWRLWEEELCPSVGSGHENDTGMGDSGPPSSPSDFVTVGTDREGGIIPAIYRLDYFCIDEEEGTLVTFADSNSSGASKYRVDLPLGKAEYLSNPAIGLYHRFMSPSNIDKIALTKDVMSGGGEAAAAHLPMWQRVISRSLEEEHNHRRRDNNGASHNSEEGGPRRRPHPHPHYQLPPSVMFVEDPALIIPVEQHEDTNPGHVFYRIATGSAQLEILNATSSIFLSDAAMQANGRFSSSKFYQSEIFKSERDAELMKSRNLTLNPPTSALPPTSLLVVPRNVSVLLALPLYLQSKNEANDALASFRQHWADAKEKAARTGVAARLIPNPPHPSALRVSGGPSGESWRRTLMAELLEDFQRGNPRALPSAPPPLGTASSVVPYLWEMTDWLSIASGRMRKATGTWPQLIAAHEAEGSQHRPLVITAQHQPWLSAGSDECEAYRCSDAPSLSSWKNPAGSDLDGGGRCSPSYLRAHRRCGRPYIAVAVAMRWTMTMNLSTGAGAHLARRGYDGQRPLKSAIEEALNKGSSQIPAANCSLMPDTQNYSRAVWLSAVRMLSREAKTFKRDMLQWGRQRAATEDNKLKRQWEDIPTVGGEQSSVSNHNNDNRRLYPSFFDAQSRVHSKLHKSHPCVAMFPDVPCALVTYVMSMLPSSGQHGEGEEGEEDAKQQQQRKGGSQTTTETQPPYAYILSWRRRLVALLGSLHHADRTRRNAALSSSSPHHHHTSVNPPEQQHSLMFPSAAAEGAKIEGVSSSDASSAPPSRLEMISEYMHELFAVLLEVGHRRERDGGGGRRAVEIATVSDVLANSEGLVLLDNRNRDDSPHQSQHRGRQQLMCYRQAYGYFVRHPKRDNRYSNKGTLATNVPSSCHSREVMAIAYRSYWNRFGMCQKGGEQGRTEQAAHQRYGEGKGSTPPPPPAADTNRDAHPIFTLPPSEQRRLQALFESSKAAMGAVMAKGIAALAAAGYTLGAGGDSSAMNEAMKSGGGAQNSHNSRQTLFEPLSPRAPHLNHDWFRYGGKVRPRGELTALVEELTAAMDAAQREYDDAFMAYFGREPQQPTEMMKERKNGDSSSSTRGPPSSPLPSPSSSRPIRIYQAHRSGKRAFANMRSMATRLMAADAIDGGADRLSGVRGSASGRGGNGREGHPHRFFKDYVEFEFSEGLYGGVASPEDDTSPFHSLPSTASLLSTNMSGSSVFTNPYARQMSAVMGADLVVGMHGADLHVMAFAKPSAFAVEIALVSMESESVRINSGFFAPLAFGRNIGYYRVPGHFVFGFPDPHAEKGGGGAKVDGTQGTMSLPDLRQMYSVTVCSWLATNAVRLADEERQRDRTEQTSQQQPTDFSYIVPWWCRGGAAASVREFLLLVEANEIKNVSVSTDQRATKDTFVDPAPSSASASPSSVLRSHQAAEAVMRPSYYSTRGVPSGYGFVVPYCVPLEATVSFADGDANRFASLNSVRFTVSNTAYTHKTLRLLQANCGQNITSGTQGDAVLKARSGVRVPNTTIMGDIHFPQAPRAMEAQRRRVEGLQTLLESALLITPVQAQRVSLAMIEGMSGGHYETTNPSFATAAMLNNRTCGELSVDIEWHGTSGFIPNEAWQRSPQCLRAMLYALTDPRARKGLSLSPPLCGRKSAADDQTRLVSQRLVAYFNTVLPVLSTMGADGDCGSSVGGSSTVINDEKGRLPFNSGLIFSDALRTEVVEWVLMQFLRVGGRPTGISRMPSTAGAEFSYGSDCNRYMPGKPFGPPYSE